MTTGSARLSRCPDCKLMEYDCYCRELKEIFNLRTPVPNSFSAGFYSCTFSLAKGGVATEWKPCEPAADDISGEDIKAYLLAREAYCISGTARLWTMMMKYGNVRWN